MPSVMVAIIELSSWVSFIWSGDNFRMKGVSDCFGIQEVPAQRPTPGALVRAEGGNGVVETSFQRSSEREGLHVILGICRTLNWNDIPPAAQTIGTFC